MKKIKIGNKCIGENQSVFIIAEIGSNHNQDIKTAKKLIDAAVWAGADAVKFQSIRYDELYLDKKTNSGIRKLFKQIQLRENWHKELFNYCGKKGILFFSAPTYLKAVDILEELEVKLYKIASPQTATFPQLIEKIARLKKPIIMSTGYCTLKEVDRAVKIVEKIENKKLALLHCISQYPTRPESANLEFIKTLKKIYNIPVGFSDHTLCWEITVASVAMGADIIEKHITLSRNQKGPDHFFALEPDKFEKMIKSIRIIEKSVSKETKLRISRKEAKILGKIKMRVLAKHNLPKGKKLKLTKDIIFRRDTEGIDAWKIYSTKKLRLKRNIKKNQSIRAVDLY